MNNFIKYAAVGVIGYLVGFYEMKRKVKDIILKAAIEELERKQNENVNDKSESN